MRLRYVDRQDAIVSRFVALMIPHVGYRGFGNCHTIGIVNEDGELIAGLVYNNWNPIAGILEINGAALPGHYWLTRETIKHMFTYPFEGCGCQMVVMRVAADNERLLRQLAIGGFTFVKVARMFGRHLDGVICTLTAEEWASNRLYRKYTPPVIELRRTQEAA